MENERIATLEEQGRWIANKVDRIDQKVDRLLEFKWKAIGAAMIAAFVATTVVELMRH